MIDEKFIRDSTFILRLQRCRFWFRFWRRVVLWTVLIGLAVLAVIYQFISERWPR